MLIQLCLSSGLAIIISALCSIAEAALYSIPISHIEVLDKAGKSSGKILKKLKRDIHKPIIAILTLNTIANTMGAAIAGAAATEFFGSRYLGIFSALFTLSILILSEIIPKTAGVVYCKEVGPFMAYPLMWLVNILKPFVWFCQRLTNMISRSNPQSLVSAKEIRAIAMMSQKSGDISRQEEKIIVNILDLKYKNARKAMTPMPVAFTLPAQMTIEEANELKDKWNLHSRVPVYDRNPDDIVGIVLRKDVLLQAAEGNTSLRLTELMDEPHFVPESVPLPNILLDFFEQRQHLFIVVDEYGGATGIISLEDVIEEIMGEEIMDESDKTRDMRALARFKQITSHKE
ncbi:hemolysin family protein [Desulfobacterota bacterium M19]